MYVTLVPKRNLGLRLLSAGRQDLGPCCIDGFRPDPDVEPDARGWETSSAWHASSQMNRPTCQAEGGKSRKQFPPGYMPLLMRPGMNMYTCIFAHTHTYMHTYVHTYMHTYIRTYLFSFYYIVLKICSSEAAHHKKLSIHIYELT